MTSEKNLKLEDVFQEQTPEDNINSSPIVGQKISVESGMDTQEKIESPKPLEAGLERWNNPRINIYRYLSVNFSMLVLGMNDAAYGALIPYLETYYGISYTVVSLLFLSPFLGYTGAAFLNNKIHVRFGQRGVAVITPLCKILSYTVTCVHPPYPVLPIVFVITGFGNGLLDAGWNAWVGNMQNANELLGFIHGAYGLGATISPLIATSMVAKGNLQWYTFYYVMLGLAVVELIICVATFKDASGAKYRAANIQTDSPAGHSRTKESLLNPITWICAIFLLCYVGVEVALGGWLVTFMINVRDGGLFPSGMVVTGFWLGLTIGRVILGFVTGRIGEKLAITAYLLISIAFELCFWLIPSFISSAVFAAWLGFFLGPLFPAVIVVATKLLPKHIHVSAIGFACAFGGGGAALFPFAVGAIAEAKGVQVLQPFALALLVALVGLWCLLPGGFSKKGLEETQRAREEGRSVRVEEGRMMWVGKLRAKIGIA